jgi:hypothetical protein
LNAHEVDPLCDPRWPEFLERHRHATILHTSQWLGCPLTDFNYQEEN